MSLTSVLNIAGSGMTAQSVRLNTTASNIANADSASSSVDETYRARKPWFSVLESEVNSKSRDVNGFMDTDAWVEVQMPGGSLFVRHTNLDASVQLTGVAQFVFQGKISV